MLRQCGQPTGCHSIAFFRQQRTNKQGVFAPLTDSVSVFDPNYGEFLIPMSDIRGTFLNWLLGNYHANVTRHRLFYLKQNK